jgi:hypothetical protein
MCVLGNNVNLDSLINQLAVNEGQSYLLLFFLSLLAIYSLYLIRVGVRIMFGHKGIVVIPVNIILVLVGKITADDDKIGFQNMLLASPIYQLQGLLAAIAGSLLSGIAVILILEIIF